MNKVNENEIRLNVKVKLLDNLTKELLEHLDSKGLLEKDEKAKAITDVMKELIEEIEALKNFQVSK